MNHTFTSHLALSASLQPYAGLTGHPWCEYPTAPSPLARAIAPSPLTLDGNGQLRAPDQPGLGVTPDLAAIRPYLRDVEIRIDGDWIFASSTS
ncbi:hypothetical protein ACQHIV_24835 [Kribbella sp. GL6]|uniref:hypothetical protein n=1 Tax=Kribbella sp. GL6 TaxID=3419765 RepID=UPI003CFD2D0D